jgi:hypothetical protein
LTELSTHSRLDGLGDIADLGLTLAEAKLLLAQVQQQGNIGPVGESIPEPYP